LRNSNIFLLGTGIGILLVAVVLVHSNIQFEAKLPLLDQKAKVIERLGITDLCLFTEAAYTRHPSQADRHTPFQDHPMSLEHFPSGSLIRPPAHVKKPYETMD
jgi:hypothetical protein